MIKAAYLAADGFEPQLAEELARRNVRIDQWHGRLALSPDPPVEAAWSLDTWTAPRLIEAPSIKSAADGLRALQRNWAACTPDHHRRSALIEARLPPVKARPLAFPEPAPTAHLGAWTLLTPTDILASPTKSSPFVNGECHFIEDRTGPPSRAYLKLWEALTRFNEHPAPGQTCFDLGAAPGGWTWALAALGAKVTAVDKAPLDPHVAAMPGVEHWQESAFAMPPEPTDWLFSDIVAYPERLLALVRRWIDAGAAKRIVCTIKFQGATDHDAADAFAAIPGGRVIHLWHNKHELTFLWTVAAPAPQAVTSPADGGPPDGREQDLP
jgi:23S rRNA (cytidine2498-2'-O)-methyltransferase